MYFKEKFGHIKQNSVYIILMYGADLMLPDCGDCRWVKRCLSVSLGHQPALSDVLR